MIATSGERAKTDSRAHFAATTAATIAAAHVAATRAANARAFADPTVPTPTRDTTFAPLKRIDAGLLTIKYAAAGRAASGSAVILLHGWPDDIHRYVHVARLPAGKKRRKVLPKP